MEFIRRIVDTLKLKNLSQIKDNINQEDLLKLKKVFTYVAYGVNCVLFPPAKVVFILWTILWVFGSSSYIEDINYILFGGIFVCGIANLIYARNKNQYLSYKIKILKKKTERLQKINSIRYGEFSNCGMARIKLNKAKQLADIVNSTYNFEEFVTSYEELIENMEFLQTREDLIPFIRKKPSENLAEIKEKRYLTEKEFVDRYIYQYGKESLESSKIYFDRLLPQTVQYINSFLNESILESDSVNNFDQMNGHDFEYFCADILKKNNFENIEVTQGSGDHGIDILAEKDGITYAIQCKRYSSNVGNAAIQQAHTGKSIYHKDIAVVLTNQYFTAQAKEEAKTLSVKLWDRDKLNSMIEKSNS